MSEKPYVSVAFVNRNDGYGGDLEARIEKFIAYYARYAARWPGLFEFVICDWNPPDGKPRLREAFEWARLGNVLHVEVPAEIHAEIAGERGRKMLDYIGRNVAIRRGSGAFALVINQDIFVSDSIMQYIGARSLDERLFYRADRCDFDFEPCREAPIERFEALALSQVFQVNRRHRADDAPISPQTGPESIDQDGSGPEPGDWLDEERSLIRCQAAYVRMKTDRALRRLWRSAPHARDRLAGWRTHEQSDIYHRGFLLHTNASGDFILAPRAAFDRIQGMWETTDIYLHLDSYAVIQLFAAGYEPAIFRQPHRVYHADHDRSARLGFAEGMAWDQHEAKLSRILRGDESYCLNDANWGLADRDLPVWRL
jgi:hypothetical protein